MKQQKTKKIRKDDELILLAGNYRGQVGKVLRVLGDRAVVQGINLRKRHMKSGGGQKGGIVTVEKPVAISNLSIAIDGKAAKTRVMINDEGQKELHCRVGGEWQFYRKY
jgi:large subunit ribosomal protein L24